MDLPNGPRLVLGAGAQVISSWIEIYLPNSRQVSIHREAAQPVVHALVVLPALDGVVVACREQKIFLGMPFDEFDVLGVTTEYGTDCKFKLEIVCLSSIYEHLLVFCFVNVYRLVPAAGGQVLTGKLTAHRPIDCLDLILMVL